MFGEKKTVYVDVEKEVPIYIPVPAYGLYNDLWENAAYLKEVCSIVDSRVWATEATEVLKQVRDMADKARTPDELKGYNNAIGVIKKLLHLKPEAIARLDGMEVIKQQKAVKK